MKSKPSTKTLKRKAWETLSKYVRSRSEGKCVTCPTRVEDWKELDCGHHKPNTERNMSLGGNALWFDLRNFGAQCKKCNRFASGRQDKFAIHLEAKYGHGILQELDQLYRTYKLWTIEELQELIKTLK